MTDLSYDDRIRAQIAQYAETINMHDLPDIFHIWSHDYIRPGLKNVFGTASIDEAYALAFMEATQHADRSGNILSVGCGDGNVEIRVARELLRHGVTEFTFTCADLSPILLGHLRSSVEREGLVDHFYPIEADLNRIRVDGQFDMIMANHALHHIEGLEHLFSYSLGHLTEHGIFATCDMIGRNGHLRWAESAAVVSALWPILSTKQQYHAQLQRWSETFVDHDCSREGFEGIRAQDILPLMLQYFKPYKFFGTGGFIDVLVDRGFGHGYDATSTEDVALIRFIADLNEIMLDSGVVKPTWTMAWFTKDDRGEVFYRDRRAITSARIRESDPAWTRFYPRPAHT